MLDNRILNVIESFSHTGFGLFTTKALEQGEFIIEYAGDLISIEESDHREVVRRLGPWQLPVSI